MLGATLPGGTRTAAVDLAAVVALAGFLDALAVLWADAWATATVLAAGNGIPRAWLFGVHVGGFLVVAATGALVGRLLP
ncbi:MAG: hypothetical protein ABEJ88_07660 [Halobacterium sp.]